MPSSAFETPRSIVLGALSLSFHLPISYLSGRWVQLEKIEGLEKLISQISFIYFALLYL